MQLHAFSMDETADTFGAHHDESRQPLHRMICKEEVGRFLRERSERLWWPRRDSNPQPSDYEPPALTIELQGHTYAYSTAALAVGSGFGVRERGVARKDANRGVSEKRGEYLRKLATR